MGRDLNSQFSEDKQMAKKHMMLNIVKYQKNANQN